MKKFLSLFFAINLTLSACGITTTPTAISTSPDIPTVTSTSIQTHKATITPLPTKPTFTPTFNPSTSITVTLSEKAACPKVNYAIPFEDGFKKIEACFKTAKKDGSYPVACLNNNLHNEILDYLNSGGDIKKILTTLDEHNFSENYLYVYKDLTGDQIPEFLLRDTFRFSYSGGYFFYKCSSGYYTIITDADQIPGITIQSIRDENFNGIPEIVFLIQNTPIIIEWNGNAFVRIDN